MASGELGTLRIAYLCMARAARLATVERDRLGAANGDTTTIATLGRIVGDLEEAQAALTVLGTAAAKSLQSAGGVE